MKLGINDILTAGHSTNCETPLPSSIHGMYSVMVIDWLQSLNQIFINVSYHIRVASLTLMAQSKTSYMYKYMYMI